MRTAAAKSRRQQLMQDDGGLTRRPRASKNPQAGPPGQHYKELVLTTGRGRGNSPGSFYAFLGAEFRNASSETVRRGRRGFDTPSSHDRR